MMRTSLAFASLAFVGTLTAACNNSDFKGSSEKLNPTVTREFVQDSYPVAQTTRKQGHTGAPQTQNFEQGEWGALDLLVVIDTSGSMTEEQGNLSTKLEPLLKHIDKADWQIAVITTDPLEGCQRSVIKKKDVGAVARFQTAIAAGIKGSGLERSIFQSVSGLKGECAGATPWVRPGSTVSVLMVTDEDNCHLDESQGYGCQGLADLQGKYLTDYLSSIRTVGKDARVYGLLWHPTVEKTACSTALKQANTIADVIESTSGKWGSICDADYTQTLEAISKDISQIVKYEFDLTQDPDEGTLKITANGQPWDKFEVTGKHVRFTEPPPFGTKVEVAYKFGASGDLAKDFSLDKLPVDGSVRAKVNGEDLEPTAYKWDATTKKVSFLDPPTERAEIKFEYKESTKLKSVFVIGSKTLDERTLRVTVDGLAATGVTYDAVNGAVTITPAPVEAAKIKVSWKDAR